MLHIKWLVIPLLCTLLWSQDTQLKMLEGTWHLRVLDGMEVRKARAILEFDTENMKLSGFDSCNRIGGALQKNSDTNITIPMLMSTRMSCREHIHTWVSQRIHQTFEEGFSIKEEKKYGVEGVTLKSPSHELFFKKMGKEK